MEIWNPDSVKSGSKRQRRRSGASVKSTQPRRQFNSGIVWKSRLFVAFVGLGVYGVMETPNMVETVNNQRVEHVIIEGEINYISEQEVLRGVNSFISESLLLVDMQEIKHALEGMPWVRSVTIRREWPDTLVLSVVEEKAIARWGENQLLNQDGAIFSPRNIAGLEQLAILSGPGGSARQVMEQYQLFNQLLYQRGLKIAELSRSERGAWKVILANGVYVNVGKENVMEKMRRLISFVDPVFVEQMVSIESIDLRYTSGIAVKTKQITAEEVVSL